MKLPAVLLALTLLTAVCSLVAAEEQPAPPVPGGPSPAPSPAVGFPWLAGEWHLSDGDVECDEYWSDPRGGTQFGCFRLTVGSTTRFLELFALEREGETTWLRIRHFSPKLESWDGEEEAALSWRLAENAERKAVFVGKESRLVYHRETDEVLAVRLEPANPTGEPTRPTAEFRFTLRKR